jgi:hypothetical protein
LRKETEREAGRAGFIVPRPLPSPVTRQRGHRYRWAVALTVGAALVFAPAVAAETKPRPCAAHPVEAAPGKVSRAACLRAYTRQRARDRMAWPPRPTEAEIRRRVERIGGTGTWAKAARVANCETGGTRGSSRNRGNARWYITADGTPTGSYIGALGMYARTFAYGARRTGYRGRTYQEQVAIAVAAWPITRGWSGWGCGGA